MLPVQSPGAFVIQQPITFSARFLPSGGALIIGNVLHTFKNIVAGTRLELVTSWV